MQQEWIERKFECTNCEGGIVVMKKKDTVNFVEVVIKKCDNCKKQYYLKQLSKLKEITLTP